MNSPAGIVLASFDSLFFENDSSFYGYGKVLESSGNILTIGVPRGAFT